MLIKKRKTVGLGLMLLVGMLIILSQPDIAIGRPKMQPPGGIGIVCTEDATAGSATFDLQTTAGYIQSPEGNSLFMWSYAPNPGFFQSPGPILCVEEGDTVTINLTNNLPEPSSIIFPGQTGVTPTGGTAGLLTNEAAASGGTVSYSFTAEEPGTYIYESGTFQHRQVHMGLYGAIIVRPAMGANFAYNDADTQFDPDQEYLLLMHEIDPNLHRAVELGQPFDVTTRHDRYWTINGRGFPDVLLDNGYPLLPNQPYGALVRVNAEDPDLNPNALPALVRYANPGTVSHPFHPHGDHLDVIAQDGRLLGNNRLETFTRTMPAGGTADLLFTWTNVERWTPGPNGAVPVVIPGLQNLVFKDGVTFYSGDPHLGTQGTLPPSVTSFNQCGEFYFPWHSHALNEVQNFDEGFGGLMTLVRVDPPPSLGLCP